MPSCETFLSAVQLKLVGNAKIIYGRYDLLNLAGDVAGTNSLLAMLVNSSDKR